MEVTEILKLFPSSKEKFQLDAGNLSNSNPSIVHLFDNVLSESLKVLTSCDSRLTVEQSADDVLLRIESLLSYIWENLHTGEWKNVDPAWRRLYSHASLLKAAVSLRTNDDIKQQLVNSIKACDMGLIMGEPILDGLLSKIADHLNESLLVLTETKKPRVVEKSVAAHGGKVEGRPFIDPCKMVETFHQPSMEKFLSEIMNKKPAIFTGVMDYWPAMTESRWSVEYLRKVAGHRTVPIEIGSKYTDDSWTQSLTTMNEFIDDYVLSAKGTGYLAQYQLFHQIPRLRDDIIIPDYCFLGESDDVQVNAWFGPKGTVSPLHFDPDHNFLSQVVGSKYIRLYDESVSSLLYPHEGMLSNTSRVDVEQPDVESFPLFASAPYLECILEAGSMLYLPPRMWHYVKSLSTSFSVSFWWK